MCNRNRKTGDVYLAGASVHTACYWCTSPWWHLRQESSNIKASHGSLGVIVPPMQLMARSSRRLCTGSAWTTPHAKHCVVWSREQLSSRRTGGRQPACLPSTPNNSSTAVEEGKPGLSSSTPAQQLLATTTEPISSAAQAAVQQLQQQVSSVTWDLDWFHYTPWWYKPPIVIIAGLSFVVGCNLGTQPSLKTTIIAAAPVMVAWFIFLWMVPRQFADFAKQYIRTHPKECAEQARKCHEAHMHEGQQQQH